MFKLDAYMSIIRNKPVSVLPEELHFTLPCTLSLWNLMRLDLWEERQIEEPPSRASMSMSSLIADSTMDTTSTTEQPMLIEDIHLCLCAMQSDVWKCFRSIIPGADCEIDSVFRNERLRERLERSKWRLDQFAIMVASRSSLESSQEWYLQLPFRQYYGFEDQSLPGWHDAVLARVTSLHFDADMLYLLLSLYLSVDIRNLAQLARDQRLSTVEELSEAHRLARQQRQVSMKGWTSTPAARSALCQAVDVLDHHKFKSSSTTSANIRASDPICYIALCVSALVVWGFCKYSDLGCESCVPWAMPVAELTKWSTPAGEKFAEERQAWIKMGEESTVVRSQIQGVTLCGCNIEVVIALFQALTPDEWTLADTIAPWIFKRSE